jgi:hypothetical protein
MTSKRGRDGERGQLLPVIGMGIFALLAMVGLALDVGYWRYQQRIQQSAADAAAIAGGIETLYSSTTTDVTAAGQAEAARNGFSNASNGVTVTINYPPVNGPYAGSNTSVEAIISQPEPSFFAGILGHGQTVTARAVAVRTNSNGFCIYALKNNGSSDPSNGNITLNGTASGLNAHTCGVISDSLLTVNGSPTIDAAAIGYGSYSAGSPNIHYTEATPAPALPVADPCLTIPSCATFAGVAAGTTTAQTGYEIPTSYVAPTTVAGVTTFNPGVYSSANPMTLGHGTYYFNPGIYVFADSGAFNSTGGVTILNTPGSTTGGAGVTIYNKGGTFSISGGGSDSVNLTSPTSGPYAGLVYYQPYSNTNTVTLSGGGGADNFNLTGMIYLPNAHLTLNGSIPQASQLVTSSITVNGQGITATGPSLNAQKNGRYVLGE